jgi:antirestriction protein ArdC
VTLMARVDFRNALKKRVTTFLEENDCLPWQQTGKGLAMRPFNPVNGRQYRGGNVFNLIHGALERNSSDPRWMTLKQANDAGYRIRKGAKKELVEYWDLGNREPPKSQKPPPPESLDSSATAPAQPSGDGSDPASASDRDIGEAAGESKAATRRPVVWYFRVFNGEDIVGLPPLRTPPDWHPHELVERFIQTTGAQFEYSPAAPKARGKLAASAVRFDSARDVIVMPARETFKTEADFDATRLGQLAFRAATQAPRNAPKRTGDNTADSGALELKAEIARQLLAGMMSVDGTALGRVKHHPQWLESLNKDRHAIFRAAREAEDLIDQMFERAPELRSFINSRVEVNILTEKPKRKIASGIDSLPNFTPARPEQEPLQGGLADPRWQSFDKILRLEAKKYSIPSGTIDKTVELLGQQFFDLMAAAERQGYTVDDMNAMLVEQLVEEMRSSARREQQWEKFRTQARQAARPIMDADALEVRLNALGHEYQEVIQRSLRENWENERTDQTLSEILFGSEGSRPVTAELVRERLSVATATVDLEDEDDLLLTPTAGGLFIQDALPADAAAMADEPLQTRPSSGDAVRAATLFPDRRDTSLHEASPMGP